MTWNPRANELFLRARDLPAAADRVALLDRECVSDADLRTEVEALLAADGRAADFLERPVAFDAASTETCPPPAEGVGAALGPYKLLQIIGEGGMGTVFMAEQTTPVRRRVALKIIKAGIGTKQGVARFEAERQALALMDHPNIAKVFDAGTTPDGRPYFVMELVKGVPITAYCDEHRLAPRDRLTLFADVCRAVQHAHQKGIIHRDLKPSNVLVAPYDGRPVVKVIDFGVAKAAGQVLTDKTLFTEFGAVVGTLEYMSPEQAELNNQDVDTRSDVYSIGVLLYELLTGTTPLDRTRVRKSAFAEVLRLIREEEPPRPSMRLSAARDALPTISAQRQTEPAKLARLLRGELDWIVMKALEKDRNRRYETANELALDVERYLAGEPVQAVPPSVGYRLRKFTRRNRGPMAAATLVLTALVVGIVGVTWGLVEAERRRAEAEDARGVAEQAREQAVGNLYDSLVREAQALRLARGTGYRVQAWDRLRQAYQLDTPKRDLDQLHQEAASSLGDLVGLDPNVFRSGWKAHIYAVAHHPKDPLVALGFDDGTIAIHHLPDWAESARWQAHPKAGIVSVAYHPDGTRLAAMADDGTITFWGAGPAGGMVSHRPLKGDALEDRKRVDIKSMTLAFTPDGNLLAASCMGRSSVRLWRAVDGETVPGLDVPDQLTGALGISGDGRLLAAGLFESNEFTVRVWDLTTREVVRNVVPHLGIVKVVALSPDGKMLACGCDAGMAAYDTGSGERGLYRPGEMIVALNFTPDGLGLVFGGQNHATKLWNLTTHREIATLAQPLSPGGLNAGWVHFIAMSPDGRTILSAGTKTVALWNLDAADERRVLKQFAGGVPGIAFSPRGDLLACVSKDQTVTLWNPATGKLEWDLSGSQGAARAVAFSSDGRLLATGEFTGGDNTRIWDVKSGRMLAAEDLGVGGVWSVNFSRDGKYIAAGGTKGWVVRKVDSARGIADTGPKVQAEPRQEVLAGVGTVCFTPDGSLLAWVGRDNAFHIWDVAAASDRPAPMAKLGGYARAIRLAAKSVGVPERGKWLEISAPGGEAVWDLATGQEISPVGPPPEIDVLPGYLKGGWCAELSPDRRWWAVGEGDGNLTLWNVTKVGARLTEAGLGWNPKR